LACYFCRSRKIACGPSRGGGVLRDKLHQTCDQCERRSLVCKFPAVSRRGARKK
ncbi:hypothetical protein CPB83DRAFT_746928, partial [Crepidotus variabilis]